jgi:amino acid transporter
VDTNVSSIYTIEPLETSLSSPIGYPILSMFSTITNSLAATDVMTTILIINFTAATIAALAAASRQLWAFARNGGLPFSHFFAPVRALFSTSRIR